MRQAIASAVLSFLFCSIAVFETSCSQSSIGAPTPATLTEPASGGSDSFGPQRMTSGSPQRVEHLTTWTETGGTFYNPPNDDWSIASQYIDWGITIQGPKAAKLTKTLNDAGIISVYYTDPNRQKTKGPEYTNDESTFAHDCNGDRIVITKLPYTFYLMNPASPDLYQLWINELQNVRHNWGGDPDYVFEDTADHINFVSSMPCAFWQPAWDASTNAMDVTFENATHEPIIYNAGDIHGLNDKIEVSPAVEIDPTTQGGLTEACFGNGFALPRPLQWGPLWLETETQLLRMQQDHRIAVCHANSLNDGAKNVDQRLYVYASYILTYDPKYSIFSEMYATPSHLTVYPEIFLVPHFAYNPVVHNINEMAQPGGTYAREFAQCHFRGVNVGGCAFIVNPSLTKHAAFPFPGKYKSTVLLSGYGVLDEGSISIDGPAPPDKLAPLSAVVAIGLVNGPPAGKP